MKKIISNIAKSVFYKLYYLYASITLRCRYSYEYHSGNLKHLSKEDYREWRKGMLTMMREHCFANYGFSSRFVYEAFAKANIDIVRQTNIETGKTPIVILSVKNDLKRLQMLVEHYRRLGVRKFAFIDNGSTDGTFEWMMEQDDIDVYKTEDRYTSFTKEGWLNRIISYYGFDRWYILTDSDELITYIGMEKYNLEHVLEYAECNSIERFRALTLDMYADTKIFSDDSQCDIMEKYCWMDSDSYIEMPREVAKITISSIVGGPRMRVMKVTPTLMKYPLVYFKRGTITPNAHFQFPYREIPNSDCVFGILHYKFMGNDLQEYIKRAEKSSGFSSGSKLKNGGYYRSYINAVKESENATFMYEKSVRFENSESLRHISLIKSISFDD